VGERRIYLGLRADTDLLCIDKRTGKSLAALQHAVGYANDRRNSAPPIRRPGKTRDAGGRDQRRHDAAVQGDQAAVYRPGVEYRAEVALPNKNHKAK